MTQIHPTAVVDGNLEAADDVVIGPHCVITGDVRIGAGTRLHGHVYLQGPLRLGERNAVYPFVSIGFAPQHVAADPDHGGPGTVIGNDNTFREQVTVHRAYTDERPTTIGDRNYLMTVSHVGHDCLVGNDTMIASGVVLGGHAILEDRVVIGGITAVHQHVRIGRGAMLSGGTATSLDILPWFMMTSINYCGGINLIGLRRNGFSRDDIDDARWIYRVLCRENLLMSSALEKLRTRAGRPLIDEAIGFIEGATRGICLGRPKASRGAAGASATSA